MNRYPFPYIIRWQSPPTLTRPTPETFGWGTTGTERDLSRGIQWLESLGHTVVDVIRVDDTDAVADLEAAAARWSTCSACGGQHW